jgi:hypothetical protein
MVYLDQGILPRPAQRQIAYAVATQFGVSPDYVRRAVRTLSPKMRKYFEDEIEDHGPGLAKKSERK